MGAVGITMATRFLATVEAPIHADIKARLASPDVDERDTTIVLGTLSNATRVFKNEVTEPPMRTAVVVVVVVWVLVVVVVVGVAGLRTLSFRFSVIHTPGSPPNHPTTAD